MYTLRYHRAFIEASNSYLNNYLNQKKDELLINVIDYFTEKWNSKTSNGSDGLMKPFIFKKLKKIESLKTMFPNWRLEKNDQIVFESYRETASQILKEIRFRNNSVNNEIKYNKRKLYEFLNVVKKLNSLETSYRILEETVYNKPNDKNNFFRIIEEYTQNIGIFTNQNNLNLIIPASYYGHVKMLEKLLGENAQRINQKGSKGLSALYLGKLNYCTNY